MLEYVIPLLGCICDSALFPWVLFPVLALCFLTCVPCFIRKLFVRS